MVNSLPLPALIVGLLPASVTLKSGCGGRTVKAISEMIAA